MSTFAPVLARYRQRAGMSQSRLGVEAGYDHSYICRLEHGTRMPHRDCVLTLAERMELNSLDTDRLLLAAGFAPRSMTTLVIDACCRLSVSDDEGTSAWADQAGRSLNRLAACLTWAGDDLDAIVQEATS
jgi:transcriptional regulator with XRE-family HTH domain